MMLVIMLFVDVLVGEMSIGGGKNGSDGTAFDSNGNNLFCR